MLRAAQTIAELRAGFRWEIPERYNIGEDICDRVAAARPDDVAIIDVGAEGAAVRHSFANLREMADDLAHHFSGLAGPGDRIGVLLPQQVETAVAHIAILKMGAIALPLFTLFGPEALLHRLRDSGARVLVTHAAGAAMIAGLRDQLPDLAHVVTVEGGWPHGRGPFEAAETGPDDPAILIYTSGTTGPPKGALHGHRVLLGHLPGVEMSHDFLPQPGDVIWTPADWAWIGGLLDVLMPALHHGVPVVAHRFTKFTGEAAFDLMRRHGVRNAFLPPTALKMMRQVKDPAPLQMRSVARGGETLGAELLDWGRQVFGCTINEFYGQTECNMVVSSSVALGDPEPGVMGWPVPGHEVAVLDEAGRVLADGVEGDIGIRAPDPVMFLAYWNRPEATAAKFRGEWLITGDRGVLQASGRIRYVARDDDVITSSGYRIGPAEIEDCLLTHPAVQLAGVVGKTDPLRGSVVAAYVVLADGVDGSEALKVEISQHVRQRLAAYEAPRVVTFMEALPMTTTGKIMRGELRKLAEADDG